MANTAAARPDVPEAQVMGGRRQVQIKGWMVGTALVALTSPAAAGCSEPSPRVLKACAAYYDALTEADVDGFVAVQVDMYLWFNWLELSEQIDKAAATAPEPLRTDMENANSALYSIVESIEDPEASEDPEVYEELRVAVDDWNKANESIGEKCPTQSE